LAVVSACLIKIILEAILGPWVQSNYGLYLQSPTFSTAEIFYMLIMMSSALLISFIPALTAMKSALKDGLSLKI
jgi:putative ABC transport system permease protein